MHTPRYTIGLDYGTNSVRAVLVNIGNGLEAAEAVWNYSHGTDGVLLSHNPNLARQHPADYLTGAERVLRNVVKIAKQSVRGFENDQVIGLGIDATGSTPLPVDRDGSALVQTARFSDEPAAMAWLWKDHTSIAEAAEITELAAKIRPHFLAKCGGSYSSEWFFSKILHCLRTSPRVFGAAYSWVECADWVPAMLTGTQAPGQLTAGICAAGHKAMYNNAWGGYPDADFLSRLAPQLADLRSRLPTAAYSIDRCAGQLTPDWARRTGLRAGIPVAVGAIDAHLGAVGSGIKPGTLVKILGTSTCDMMVVPASQPLPDIPGLCGIVPDSILPGYYGLEAGQPAVGDIFNWFVNYIRPLGKQAGSHVALSKAAAKIPPGASGLLALDWNNGNRNVLADPRLSGLLVGQTLYTTPPEIYRALIEATAFGALKIIERFEEYRLSVERIVVCGGIAEKNPLVGQIYADVTGRTILLSRAHQTCALGAAIAGAVVAGKRAGGYECVEDAQKAMTGLKTLKFRPNKQANAIYGQLYRIYGQCHDAFGTTTWRGNLHGVMKDLIAIRNRTRR